MLFALEPGEVFPCGVFQGNTNLPWMKKHHWQMGQKIKALQGIGPFWVGMHLLEYSRNDVALSQSHLTILGQMFQKPGAQTFVSRPFSVGPKTTQGPDEMVMLILEYSAQITLLCLNLVTTKCVSERHGVQKR